MEELKRVLAQEDTVLFVGSGISQWSGIPSWPRLIHELAEFLEASGASADLVRTEAQRGDLLQAASYGFYKLTKQQIGDFIRKVCRYGVARPHDIHRKLVSLGPRCFITTNYDNLIEESLRIWQPDRFFRPPVTNRHLTETAEIVHARAIDFVFKPHGDAADSESIILTREQYRQLLPGGERQAALESVKMLLASRPVVYVGFGLRDPDFIYVRDLLSNTYKGGTRDHFAIMADIVEAEVDYWRINYGIHLTGYATVERADKSKDHSPLLKVLDHLLLAPPSAVGPRSITRAGAPCPPGTVLALARHAARLSRAPKADPEFPLYVRLQRREPYRRLAYLQPDQFDDCPIERFLDEGPSRALLTGLPGSGKSYSLERAAARLAERLHESCLSEAFDEKGVVVPLLADLKFYRGRLDDLVNRTLPSGLSLDFLAQRLRVRVFLDSFNEMPREYWEEGSYGADFAKFIAANPNASLVIGSRTSDGLSELGFPSYCLDEVHEGFVAAELERLGIKIGGRFQREIRWLLQKPFYFQLVTSGRVALSEDAHPRDFYRTFFGQLAGSLEERLGKRFDLERALSLIAYEAIDQGEEARPLASVLEVFETELQGAGLGGIPAQDVINWLVSKLVLIPYTGSRIALFHQSATEYLAAGELSRRYQLAHYILKEKLRLTRWDQALFLTLSFLPANDGATFLQAVVEADLAVALNAAKYLESGRDEIVSSLLSEIPRRIIGSRPLEFQIESALEFGLPLSEAHEPQLRALMRLRGSIGAAAVVRLVELKGPSVKDELVQSLAEAEDDYNYCCNGVGKSLKPFATPDDVKKIVALADSIQSSLPPDADPGVVVGFTSGAAGFLAGLNLSLIREGFLPKTEWEPLSDIRAQILCHILWEHHSTAALDLAGELLLRGVDDAATAMYFISTFAKPEDCLSWATFTPDHVNRLVGHFRQKQKGSWALQALECLCKARPDMADVVRARARKASGITKAALLYCACSADSRPVFESLSELAEMSPDRRRRQPIHLLEEIELDWAGHETLLVQLLRLRNAGLALALLAGIYPDFGLGELEVGPIDWWLDWLIKERDTESTWWLLDRMAALFARVLNASGREALVAEFNKSGSKFRRLLAEFILPRRSDLTTDVFSEDAVSFLLADLNRAEAGAGLCGHLLGLTATEQFVTERLLPLLPEAKPPLSDNLVKVLRQAGSRHGRRYVAS